MLLGTGLFLLVLPLVIGRDEGWPAWSFAFMGASPIVLAAFAGWERTRTQRSAGPLIDTTLFRQRPFSLGLLACLVFFAGVIFFGLLGLNASSSSASVAPQLRHDLTAAGVPAPAQRQITSRFQACFSARAHAKDPTAEPAICAAAARRIAASPAPEPVKARIAAAVERHALPAARLADFTRSMPTALWWQVAVFALALFLCSRLPSLRVDEATP